jgi:hypothetical protein
MLIAKREIPLTVELTISLKKELDALAETERRSVENQTISLIESGLAVFEWGIRHENFLP